MNFFQVCTLLLIQNKICTTPHPERNKLKLHIPTYYTNGFYRVDWFICALNFTTFQFDGDFSLALNSSFADVINVLNLPVTILTLTPRDVDLWAPDVDPGLGLSDHIDCGRHKEERSVEHAHQDHEDHVDSAVVSNLVRHKSNDGRTDENTERKDGVDEANVHVTDADVFHVDGEVGEDGVCGPTEHEQSNFEGK